MEKNETLVWGGGCLERFCVEKIVKKMFVGNAIRVSESGTPVSHITKTIENWPTTWGRSSAGGGRMSETTLSEKIVKKFNSVVSNAVYKKKTLYKDSTVARIYTRAHPHAQNITWP